MHNQESVRLPAVLPDSGAAAMLVDHRRMDHKADGTWHEVAASTIC